MDMNPETQRIFEKLVVERRLVTPEQLETAQRRQAETGRSLLEALIEQKAADRQKLRDLAQVAALRSGAERVSIGGFELLEKIGQGGMGAVYRASQTQIGRFVALKLMRPRLARNHRYLERFLREARASAQLSHPNIVQGIDAGQDKGYYYFAMEFVDGDTLRRQIGREGALPESRCLQIGVQVARALEHAARYGIVHRDIKPENILIEHETGIAKLADLGLVKSTAPTDTSITQAGVALGTPNYISPEQAKGEETIDTRSDIYSLGATLYHAVTGSLPFEGDSAPVVMSHHMKTPLEPAHRRKHDVSVRFSRILQKMMAKKAEQRYQTPTELLEDLERLARGEQPGALQQVGRRRRPAAPAGIRRPKLALGIVIASGVLTLGLAGLLTLLMGGPGDTPSDPGVEAAIRYRRAADLIESRPREFAEIRENLSKCLELDPDGPHAARAAALLEVAKSFEARTVGATESPAAWLDAAQRLQALAGEAPDDPDYAAAIRAYLQSTGRRLAARVVRQAVLKPTTVPEGLRWLDAIERGAADTGVAEEARAKQKELAKVLRENADTILDQYARDAKKEAGQGRFGAAIRILRSSIPDGLMTERLRTLVEKRAQAIREEAARYVDERHRDVWKLLDHGAAKRAQAQAEHLRKNLGLKELAPRVEQLCRTCEAAPEFLPRLDALAKLAKAEPKDVRAVGSKALELQEEYGSDPYVAQRLEDYEAAIARVRGEGRVEAELAAAEKLIAAGKPVEADAVISRALQHPAVTAEQRRRAVTLRLKLGPIYGLSRRMAAALEPRLPVANVRLRLEGRAQPLTCDITGVSARALRVEADSLKTEYAWTALGPGTVQDLALGRLGLIEKDDPGGLYDLGAYLFEHDPAESRRLLGKAVELARKQTDAQLPGRVALISSAELLLHRITEHEAERAAAALARLVPDATGPRTLDRAVEAWRQFKDKYGKTDYAKAEAERLTKLRQALSERIFKVRTASLTDWIREGRWEKLVERLERTREETRTVAPLPPPQGAMIDRMLRFGRDFLVEQIIYRTVFITRPWRGLELAELKTHENKRVAERATRYAKMFDVDVEAQPSAEEQRRYATHEQRGEDRVYVRDVNTRLARFNAVFTFWRRERDHCAWAEIEAAREFRHTGRGGNLMTILMMDHFLERARRGLSKDLHGHAEYTRLQAFIRRAEGAGPLRQYVIQHGLRMIREYRGVADFPARFCLMVAEQYEAAGEDDHAYTYYEKLLDARSKYKRFTWHGYLGRGRIKKRRERYVAALFDYDLALKHSTYWHEGYRVARAICDLCIHSGKLDKREHAEAAVNEVLKRASHPSHLERTRRLLEKK
jgi:serine/threonine-protein kinase